MEENIIGFKDMHSAQIAEFMNFVAHSLDVSCTLSEETGDDSIFSETQSMVESLVEMFGGQALIIDQMSPESSDLEQG